MEILDLLKSTNRDDVILGVLLMVDNNLVEELLTDVWRNDDMYDKFLPGRLSAKFEGEAIIYKNNLFWLNDCLSLILNNSYDCFYKEEIIYTDETIELYEE